MSGLSKVLLLYVTSSLRIEAPDSSQLAFERMQATPVLLKLQLKGTEELLGIEIACPLFDVLLELPFFLPCSLNLPLSASPIPFNLLDLSKCLADKGFTAGDQSDVPILSLMFVVFFKSRSPLILNVKEGTS